MKIGDLSIITINWLGAFHDMFLFLPHFALAHASYIVCMYMQFREHYNNGAQRTCFLLIEFL